MPSQPPRNKQDPRSDRRRDDDRGGTTPRPHGGPTRRRATILRPRRGWQPRAVLAGVSRFIRAVWAALVVIGGGLGMVYSQVHAIETFFAEHSIAMCLTVAAIGIFTVACEDENRRRLGRRFRLLVLLSGALLVVSVPFWITSGDNRVPPKVHVVAFRLDPLLDSLEAPRIPLAATFTTEHLVTLGDGVWRVGSRAIGPLLATVPTITVDATISSVVPCDGRALLVWGHTHAQLFDIDNGTPISARFNRAGIETAICGFGWAYLSDPDHHVIVRLTAQALEINTVIRSGGRIAGMLPGRTELVAGDLTHNRLAIVDVLHGDVKSWIPDVFEPRWIASLPDGGVVVEPKGCLRWLDWRRGSAPRQQTLALPASITGYARAKNTLIAIVDDRRKLAIVDTSRRRTIQLVNVDDAVDVVRWSNGWLVLHRDNTVQWLTSMWLKRNGRSTPPSFRCG